MARGPIASSTLNRAFTTALLLTASVAQAEAALLEGISALQPGEASEDNLCLEAILAAVAPKRHETGLATGTEDARSFLPPGLAPVLELAPDLRQCFVLRALMSMPREFCSRLLRLDVGEVDENLGRAAQALAQIANV